MEVREILPSHSVPEISNQENTLASKKKDRELDLEKSKKNQGNSLLERSGHPIFWDTMQIFLILNQR